jgi:uncharacterized membrane protein YgcG
MKTILTFIAVAASIVAVHSQAPAPAQAQSALQQLQTIRDANLKLLEQQAKTIEQVAEMEKVAQHLKILSKRS